MLNREIHFNSIKSLAERIFPGVPTYSINQLPEIIELSEMIDSSDLPDKLIIDKIRKKYPPDHQDRNTAIKYPHSERILYQIPNTDRVFYPSVSPPFFVSGRMHIAEHSVSLINIKGIAENQIQREKLNRYFIGDYK